MNMKQASDGQRPPSILTTHDITKRFGEAYALAGVSINIAVGDSVAIMGPSGSGKSTLLHCLSGVLLPDQGRVDFNGQPLSRFNDRDRSHLRLSEFGFVFQDGQLIPELSARENVALPLMLTGTGKGKALAAADDMLGRIGLAELRKRRPGEMSGGQAQRVATARALVGQPKVVFADEPSGALDQATGHEVMQLLESAVCCREPAMSAATTLAHPRTRVQGLTDLTLTLTKARFAARQGEALLYAAAIVAFAISSALALTIAGGTVMFFNRWQHPVGVIAELIAQEESFDLVMMFYFILALIACVLVVPSIISLAASAAVLGARGRERRLAALRLIGLSSGDVTRMSLIDTAVQAVVGTIIGTLIYLATLPAWGHLEMQATAIGASEMLLPWYLLVGVMALVVVLGLVAAWWGLQQVRISPLGVARRTVNRGLKAWRIIVFLAALIAGPIWLANVSLGYDMAIYGVLIAVMLVMIWALNIAGPWLLQQLSRVMAQLPWPSVIWAARRIQAAPKVTWQRVSGIALLALVGSYIAFMGAIELDGSSAGEIGASFAAASQWDFTKGAIITLACGFLLTATSILINQASAVFERAEQSVAMHKMGAPFSYGNKVMWLETLGPLVMATVLGAVLGALMAMPMYELARSHGMDAGPGPFIMATVLAAGLGLTVLALAACHPLQRNVLAQDRRAND